MNYLVDPEDVINYNRDDAELELFWLFCLVVAGKTAKTQARLLDEFLRKHPGDTPFQKLRSINNMVEAIKESRLGQYNRLAKAFQESLNYNLRTCSVQDLEQISGVGPKTARMFVMMTRPNQRLAILDVHILRHLRENGIKAPKNTPSGKQYQRLESEFLGLVDCSGMTPAEYDLHIWTIHSRR